MAAKNARPGGERSGPWLGEGGWHIPVVTMSFGLLAPVPFVHMAVRLRTPLSLLWPLLYLAAVGGLFTLVGAANTDAVWAAMGLISVSLTHLHAMRRQAWPPRPVAPQVPPPLPAAADPAVARALAARDRRIEARALAARDPLLARDLEIGRPDRPSQYHDGGLVDLNSAPAEVIAATCGIDASVGRRIVEARETAGVPFAAVDDVFAYADIPVELWDRIRDRAVVIGHR